MIDAKAFGAELAGIVKAATAPLQARIDALEKALADRPEPEAGKDGRDGTCLLYTSPSPRDATLSRMPSSA